MRFTIKEWKLKELYMKRSQIIFPVYQRQEVWSEGKKQLLIDSIFQGIDIPKFYLQYKVDDAGNEGWDCIDGHQRISAIVGYFDGDFEYEKYTFDQLSPDKKYIFEEYKLTITEVTEIEDEEVRLLFQRLQLGIPLNSGEKLNSIISNMGELVKIMIEHPFIKRVNIPERRYAKQQVCAQICNNSKFIRKTDEFINSKYEDLEILYKVNKDIDLDTEPPKSLVRTLDVLGQIFGDDAAEITNRASVISIYLFVEEMLTKNLLKGKEEKVRDFYLSFLSELRSEVRLGIDATNRFLLAYQSKVIQAADSKSSISERHDRLKEAFQYYLETGRIIH